MAAHGAGASSPLRSRVLVFCVGLAAASLLATGSSAGASANAKRLAWHPCGSVAQFDCARLRVPVNWRHPRGAKLRLALTRLPATNPKHRVGSLLFNCGGPGCPSAEAVRQAAPNGFTDRLRARFDIIGWDPRGIGKSKHVQCGRRWFFPSAHVYPPTRREFEELVTRNRALARSCRRLTGPLVNHVGARSTVHDMEAIRKALHDGKLNYLGLSYGTLLGAIYAERYPHRVRTLALDGALEGSLPAPVMLANEASTAEDVFNRWAAWCEQNPSCPLHGQDVPQVYDDLVAAANRSPIPAPRAQDPHRVSGEEIQNSTDANYLLFEHHTPLFPDYPTWKDLGPAIVEAQNGDASELATEAPGPPDDPMYQELAVECLDFPSQASTFTDLHDYGVLASDLAQHLGGATQTGQIASGCIGWPHPKRNPRQVLRVRGAPPTLIVNATHDPSTSYEWALSMHAQIKPSRLLTRIGNGHTSFTVSSCARRRIDAYLISRTLPEPGATCSP